ASVQLSSSGTMKFSASVTGTSNSAVHWSLNGPGIVSEDGTYTAPSSVSSQQTAQVTATSVAPPKKSATATITIVPITVRISPTNALLHASESQTFHALVEGGQGHLIWRLTGAGQLSSSGVYTAPHYIGQNETAQIMVYISADPGRQAFA